MINYVKWAWVVGGVVAASILDLAYMFWSRSNSGHNFSRAGWNASTLGRGHYNIMGMAKHISNRGKY